MASYLDKFRIKEAAGRTTKFHYTSKHVMTSDFMDCNVSFCRELVPRENFRINISSFSRMAAMPLPTFGDATLNNRAFFVPYRIIFPQWDEFMTDTQSPTFNGRGGGTVQKVPFFTNQTLIACLTQAVFVVSGTSTDNDFVLQTDNGYDYYKWTNLGRKALKILNQLGYQPIWSTLVADDVNSVQYSALPLLAFVKVYNDWYWPSQYYSDSDRLYLESLFHQMNLSGFELTSTDLIKIFTFCCYVCYDSDPFTAAFDNPVGPTSGAFTRVTIEDNTNNLSSGFRQKVTMGGTNMPSNGTPGIINGNNSLSNQGAITQFVVDSLKRLTDYISRHRLVGARAVDRFLSRWGIALNSEAAKRSQYIGSNVIDMHVSDVNSTTDTASSGGDRVGDYAGKGIVFGNDGTFEYQADDFGMFMIFSSIVPKIGYYQGIDPHCFRLNRLDFATPEFDGVGTELIRKCELFVPESYDTMIKRDLVDGGFAFRPRYAPYKQMLDKVSGDFRISSRQVGDTSPAWHLFRMFTPSSFSNSTSAMVHSAAFCMGEDATSYNRIFYNTTGDADHFYIVFRFNVDTHAPLSSLYDNYDFEGDGKQLLMDVNGVKLN